MKIQILHVRDPDGACTVDLWIDGQLVSDGEIEDVDPGRGWDLEDWQARIADAQRLPEGSYKNAVLAALSDPPRGFDYITGWER